MIISLVSYVYEYVKWESMEKEEYSRARKEELQVIKYICNVWSKNRWELEQTSMHEDMLGIDAKGKQKNKTCDDTRLLVQIKSDSWLSLPSLKQTGYLRRISNNMKEIDPLASRRLIIYRKTGKKIRLWNYSIDKLLESPLADRFYKFKQK